MSTSKSSSTHLSQQMFAIIECLYRIGLTRRQIYQQEGISLSKLNYWIARYRKQNMSFKGAENPIRAFVLLEDHPLPLQAGDTGYFIELELPEGLLLRIYRKHTG